MPITEDRMNQGATLEELSRTDWPEAGPSIVADSGGHAISEDNRTFFRSLRPRALTALIIGIDR